MSTAEALPSSLTPKPGAWQIGRWTIAAPVVLAPMAGVTDRPFRMLAREWGAGLAASEMITSDERLWHSRKSRLRRDHAGEAEPRVVQLTGAEPAVMAQAARRNVDLGAQIIDINMGCPAKKVCNRLCGSALLQDEDLVARILEAVVEAVTPLGVPVTLKTRTGWDREHRNAASIAHIAEQAGIAALALHGRTRADFYQGAAEHETLAAIRDAVSMPLIANGDIRSAEQARGVQQQTRAEAVMLGRAAQGAPWIFRDIRAHLLGEAQPEPLSRATLRAIVLGHLQAIYAFYGEESGLRIARKHLAWYSALLQDASSARTAFMASASTAEQFACAAQRFDEWAQAESDSWQHPTTSLIPCR